MNKVCLCIYVVDQGQYYEAIFDANISLDENLKLLRDISNIYISDNYYVFLEDIPLKRDVPLMVFCLPQFTRLSLFNGKI